MENQVQRGVKVTYIETQFVTSDAAGFKDLVQRLTGRSPAAAPPAPPAPPPHRPRACRAGGGRRIAAAGPGPQAADYHYYQSPPAGQAPACLQDLLLGVDDFSDLFYVGASEQRRQTLNSGYSDFLY